MYCLTNNVNRIRRNSRWAPQAGHILIMPFEVNLRTRQPCFMDNLRHTIQVHAASFGNINCSARPVIYLQFEHAGDVYGQDKRSKKPINFQVNSWRNLFCEAGRPWHLLANGPFLGEQTDVGLKIAQGVSIVSPYEGAVHMTSSTKFHEDFYQNLLCRVDM